MLLQQNWRHLHLSQWMPWASEAGTLDDTWAYLSFMIQP